MKGPKQFWDGRITRESVSEIRQKTLEYLNHKGRLLWTEKGQLAKLIWEGTIQDDADTMSKIEAAVTEHINETGWLSWND